MGESQLLFTPAAILDLLLQIEEFKDVELGVTETAEGEVIVVIGDNQYIVKADKATDVEVEDDVVQEIAETAEAAYDDISLDDEGYELEDFESTEDTAVEGGIIKEALKSLMLGGLIRFANKHLVK